MIDKKIRRYPFILAITVALGGFFFFDVFISSSNAATGDQSNPIAGYWRQVREGVQGYSAVRGAETGILIQGSGENWRNLRNGPVATVSAWMLAATILALGCFFTFRGSVRLTRPKTGITVPRWSRFERVIHWYTAILFLALAITGLCLLYGRKVMIPFVGHEVFANIAELAKLTHNFAGPLFIAGLLLMIIHWFRDNIPNRLDLEWFKAFGGMIGDKHPSAERMNGGEKAWFWLLFFAGIGVSVSGLLLDFPNLGSDRFTLQISHLVHSVLAIILIVGSFGHIYIGTVGTEGAFEGMISGKVDTSWAEQHHDLWLDELTSSRQTEETQPESDSLNRMT